MTTDPSMKARLDANIVVANTKWGWFDAASVGAMHGRGRQGAIASHVYGRAHLAQLLRSARSRCHVGGRGHCHMWTSDNRGWRLIRR